MIYIDLTEVDKTEVEKPKLTLCALKINKDVLEKQNKTIQDVASLLCLKDNYVIGYDETLSMKGIPHYHIHYGYAGSFEAAKKHKQRHMVKWGTATKLFEAKEKENSDPYCWYGYAIKENIIFASPDLDMDRLKQQAHTQRAFKESKLKYGKKVEDKKVEKKTYEQKLFERCDTFYLDKMGFFETAKHISRISLEELESFLTISRVEYYTWKFLLTRKHISHSQYLESFQYKYNNLVI